MVLILASASSIRRQMLDAAVVAYDAIPSSVNEATIKTATATAEAIVRKLAEAKAIDVSVKRPDEWVVGSDSAVSVDGRLFDKPRSRDEAADHLRFFSGKDMQLASAVTLARCGEVMWHCADSAILHVRPLSEEFIQNYLDTEWPEVGYCVGVFRLEGRGVQLFESIDGDYFTILGMPLIPLLGALRERGLLSS